MSIFVDEVSKLVGLPMNELAGIYKIVNVGGRAVRISGYQKILVYTKERLVLKIKDDSLVVLGKNMVILQMEKDEMLLKGIIDQIHLGSVEGK